VFTMYLVVVNQKTNLIVYLIKRVANWLLFFYVLQSFIFIEFVNNLFKSYIILVNKHFCYTSLIFNQEATHFILLSILISLKG
jgi:hypothetical protein